MPWLYIIIAICLVCFVLVVCNVHKTYQQYSNSLEKYDNYVTNLKTTIPFITGICLPQFLYFTAEGINKWLSIIVVVAFLATFLVMTYSFRKKVKNNSSTMVT